MAKEQGKKKGKKKARQDTEAFLSWLSEVPDPQARYERATAELVEAQRVVQELSFLRAKAVAEVAEGGESVRGVAKRIGVSPARANQLIQEGKAKPASAPAASKRGPKGPQKGSTE